MKEYKKTYENLYRTERIKRRFRIDRISAEGMSLESYVHLFSSEARAYYRDLFQHLVRIAWLMRKYRIDGRRRSNMFWDNEMFSYFMKILVGYDAWMLKKFNSYGIAIASYFDDFFPDFEINNPFKSKYKYPYYYMTLDCLVFVKNITERMELLAVGEKKKLKYVDFIDYVANHILCYNEENGKDIYTIKRNPFRVVKLK